MLIQDASIIVFGSSGVRDLLGMSNGSKLRRWFQSSRNLSRSSQPTILHWQFPSRHPSCCLASHDGKGHQRCCISLNHSSQSLFGLLRSRRRDLL